MAITPLSLVFPKVNQKFVRYLTAHGENWVWDLFHRSLVSYFLKSPAFDLTQFVQVKENVRLTGIGLFTFGLFIQCLISLISRADQTRVQLWACRLGVKHLPRQAGRQSTLQQCQCRNLRTQLWTKPPQEQRHRLTAQAGQGVCSRPQARPLGAARPTRGVPPCPT